MGSGKGTLYDKATPGRQPAPDTSGHHFVLTQLGSATPMIRPRDAFFRPFL